LFLETRRGGDRRSTEHSFPLRRCAPLHNSFTILLRTADNLPLPLRQSDLMKTILLATSFVTGQQNQYDSRTRKSPQWESFNTRNSK